MTIKIQAYKNGSASAKALRDILGVKMLLQKGSKWKGKHNDKVINWGSSQRLAAHVIGNATYVNDPDSVANAACKLKTQRVLSNNPETSKFTLPYVLSKEAAEEFIDDGDTVVCRTVLNGHSGKGIVIATTKDELVDAPLYTLYRKKKDEYRVHVFDGEVIDVQRKARAKDVPDEEVNWKVRNLDGGFIFARKDVVAPFVVLKAAVEAVKALGLVHGAVDIGYNDKVGTYIYEVNTACGLEGSTIINYAKAFNEYLGMGLHIKIPEDYIPMNVNNKIKPVLNVDVLANEMVQNANRVLHIEREVKPVNVPIVGEDIEDADIGEFVDLEIRANIANHINVDVEVEPVPQQAINGNHLQKIREELKQLRENGKKKVYIDFKHGNFKLVVDDNNLQEFMQAVRNM